MKSDCLSLLLSAMKEKGVIKGFSDLFGFVLESGAKAKKINPTIECVNYCYINYLDNEYKDKDINIAYVEETLSMGKESDEIKFKQFPEEKLLSLKYLEAILIFTMLIKSF